MIELLRRHSFSLAFAAALLLLLVFFGGEENDILQLSGYTMGTTYRLQFVGLPDEKSPQQLEADITGILNRLDREIFSTYAEQSELSIFNRSTVGVPVEVSEELLEVVVLAREISDLTDGAFDITVGPLVNLWGFGPQLQPERVPSEEAISQALQGVGYRNLHIDTDRSTLIRQTDIYVDLSGIAKGYAVDKLAAYFDANGIDSYFLEVGGELKIKGLKPRGEYWVPAVERPVDSAPQVFEILNSRGEELAIAGSGDYRNYFESDGKRYSHEIDPRSGKPITHNLAAVYVITRDTARADALATAFMVLGFEQGMKLARSADLAAYFIVRESEGFKAHHTTEFARYLEGGDSRP